MDGSKVYFAIGYVLGFLSFWACWIYAVFSFGWFLGIAFGWIPSLIIALIVVVGGPFLLFFGLLFLAYLYLAQN